MSRVSELALPRSIRWAIVVTVALRLAMLVVSPMKDEGAYEQLIIARNAVTGHGFDMAWPYWPNDAEREKIWQTDPTPHPSAFMPPFVPAFYAAVYAVTGPGATGIYVGLVIQCLVGGLIPLLVYRIARRLATEKGSTWAAWASLLYLPGLLSSATPAGAIWYSVMALWVIDVAQQVYANQGRAWLLGISLGLMALMRGEFLYIGLALAAVPLLQRRYAQTAVCLTCMAVTIAPWTIRNIVHLGEPVVIVSHPWREIWRGTNPRASGSGYDAEGWSIWEGERFPHITTRLDSVPLTPAFEVEADKVFRDESLSFIREYPDRWLVLLAKKFAMLWTVDPYYPRGTNIAFVLPSLATSVMIIIGAWMMVVSVRSSRTPIFSAIPITVIGLLLVAVFSLTYVQPRYQIYLFTALFPLVALPLQTMPKMTRGFGFLRGSETDDRHLPV